MSFLHYYYFPSASLWFLNQAARINSTQNKIMDNRQKKLKKLLHSNNFQSFCVEFQSDRYPASSRKSEEKKLRIKGCWDPGKV